jgi:hypothetical protein
MDSNKEDNEIKNELIKYFPTVLADMILSYIHKCKLQYIESIVDDVTDLLIYNDNIYICNHYAYIIYNSSKMYDLAPIKEFKKDRVIAFIDENIVLLSNLKNSYYFFNIENLQIVEDSNFIINVGEYNDYTLYCTSNNKYIILKNTNKIYVVNIIKPNNIIYTIDPKIEIMSDEISVVDDIIYITCSSLPKILRYKISGEFIDEISFLKDFIIQKWRVCHVKITNSEIIIISGNNVLFYDLDGVKYESFTIDHHAICSPCVTSKYIYVKSNRKFHKYKRVM